MIDLNLIIKHKTETFKKLKSRGFVLEYQKIIILENERKTLQQKIEKLNAERKKISALIYHHQKNNLKDFSNLSDKINKIKNKIIKYSKKLNIIKNDLTSLLLNIPNIPDTDVPAGINDKNNIKISYWGEKPEFNFKIKNHVEIGIKKNQINFSAGSKLAGSRFVVMQSEIALMYRALIQFMMDIHTKKHGYLEMIVPYLVNYNSLYCTSQLPKFSEDLFHTYTLKNNKKYFLIPTAEVPLTNIIKNETLIEKNLPIKMVACTPCFRSEAGSYGKDNRGLIRMHQFDKVELIHFVKQEDSASSLKELVKNAAKILKLLKLHYRKVLLCTGNMGFGASKTYDLEVWLPSTQEYLEVSSCSNMKDFQSRRMKAFYKKDIKNKNKKLIHTLNGSGLAIGRTLIAILENYQQRNGKIKVPKVLKKYMNNLDFIN